VTTPVKKTRVFEVYKAECNGKAYIGQTCNGLKARRAAHESAALSPRTPFHRAIKLYGKDKFTWSVMVTTSTKKDADRFEVEYIKLLGTHGKGGYNMTDGGASGVRYMGTSEHMARKLLHVKITLTDIVYDRLWNIRTTMGISVSDQIRDALEFWEAGHPVRVVTKVKRK
jgi:hypothetical protein